MLFRRRPAHQDVHLYPGSSAAGFQISLFLFVSLSPLATQYPQLIVSRQLSADRRLLLNSLSTSGPSLIYLSYHYPRKADT